MLTCPQFCSTAPYDCFEQHLFLFDFLSLFRSAEFMADPRLLHFCHCFHASHLLEA